jgi:hypothetical protein
MTIMVGHLTILWSHGTGADVMSRPRDCRQKVEAVSRPERVP